MINPKSTTTGTLFNIDVRLKVPKYQRKYTWSKSEVLELMADLKSAMQSDSATFLGSFVFDTASDSENKIYNIVDGQQRVTTLALLLIACREHAKSLERPQLAQEIQKRISFTDPTTGEMLEERVLTSPSINDVFAYIASSNWEGHFPDQINGKGVKLQSRKLRPLYEYMKKELEVFSNEELSRFLKAVYASYVIQIDIQSELEAFNIFERMNARGQSLTAADLVKNYLYQNLTSTQDIDIESQWDDITRNAGDTLQRMLKYFWVSRNGHVLGSELYKKVKQYGQDQGAQALTRELFDFSEYYAAVRSNDKDKLISWLRKYGFEAVANNEEYQKQFVAAVQGLNLFKVTQHIPLVYSIFTAYGKTEKSENLVKKVLLRLLKNIEKYHFINNQICERIGNEVEKPYAEFSKRFAGTTDFRECAREFNTMLSEKLANEFEFVSRFVELDYNSLEVPETVYIFDRINNYSLNASQWKELYNTDPQIVKSNFNREHFLSQNPEFDVSEEDMEVVNNIGNLFVISRHTNSQLQNRPPEEKIGLLREKGLDLRYVIEFVKQFDNSSKVWGKNEILTRANELATKSYHEVWKLEQI